MTGSTFSGQIGIAAIGMTLITGGRGVTSGKREERMGKAISRPGKTIQRMTLDAVFWISALYMIWVGGCEVVSLVTIVTLHAPWFKTQQ